MLLALGLPVIATPLSAPLMKAANAPEWIACDATEFIRTAVHALTHSDERRQAAQQIRETVENYTEFSDTLAATDACTALLETIYDELATAGHARFRNHPNQQTATMVLESPNHPSTTMLPKEWVRFDEWYNFTANPREDVHVLLTLDESTYNGGSMGEDHPISWCHNFEGGRAWYEGAGHVDSSYSDPLFLQHLLGGIEWTAGVVEGGGNCVTFKEVDTINDGLSEGSVRTSKLTADVAEYLAVAEAAADAGEHARAAHILKQAQAKSEGLQDATLTAKVGDLVEWQKGLVGF